MPRRSILRPRHVAINDRRCPMLRLLQDANVRGNIQVNYEAQFKTLWKAQRLGYVDDNQDITEAGKQFVAERVNP